MSQSQSYMLGRGYRSTARLNLQHYVWKQQLGYLIHPNIRDDPTLKVADLGTGSGIWLLDLSDQLPDSATLDGFDVDLSQCPPGPWLPRNVSVRELDIFDELPEDLYGKYDIVHLRFFLPVVKDGDPTKFIAHALKMLKPNGWIQWTEQDLATARVAKAFAEAETQHTDELFQFAIATLEPRQRVWVANLASTFKSMGLEDVLEDRIDKISWHLPASHDNILLAIEEMGAKLPEESQAQKICEMAAEEYERGERGVAIVSDRVTIVGRKPA